MGEQTEQIKKLYEKYFLSAKVSKDTEKNGAEEVAKVKPIIPKRKESRPTSKQLKKHHQTRGELSKPEN